MLEEPASRTIPLGSALEFIDALRLTGREWRGGGKNWGFRGQASAEWRLVPKAFRPGVAPSPASSDSDGLVRLKAVTEILRWEKDRFAEFFNLADAIGLYIPGAERLHHRDYSRELETGIRGHTWPPEELTEGLAIAQHHGVPTRLLDFTRNPLVAAFWAGYHAFVDEAAQGRLAVWAVNLAFVKHAWRTEWNVLLSQYEGSRIRLVQVPAARNRFLLAQQGFFVVDDKANEECLRGGGPRPVDEVMVERAEQEDTWVSLQKNFPQWSQVWDRPVLLKLTLPTSEAARLIELLYHCEDVSMARLMPTFGMVTETVRLMKDVKGRLGE